MRHLGRLFLKRIKLIETLLGSLPRSFATLVTAIKARMDGVSLDYVQQALIREEMKQHERSVERS